MLKTNLSIMNNFRLILVLCLVIFTGLNGFAQNHNQKLLVKYDSQNLTEMKQSPNYNYDVLYYYVDKGYHFVDMPEKAIQYEELKKVNPQTGEIVEDYVITESDLVDFNPLEWNCEIKIDKRGYYKVGNTGQLLIVYPLPTIENRVENEKRLLKNK